MTITWRRPLRYLSAGDESAFFRWLSGIPGVVSVTGKGRALEIRLRSTMLSAPALRELLAVYKRYGGNLRDLAVLESPSNRAWFRDPAAFWYRSVFGSTSRASKTKRVGPVPAA